jgi:hypothetical protein
LYTHVYKILCVNFELKEGHIRDHCINEDATLKPTVKEIPNIEKDVMVKDQKTMDDSSSSDIERIYTNLTELIKLNDDSQTITEQEKQIIEYDYIRKALAQIQEAIFNEKIKYYILSFDLYKQAVSTLIKGTCLA